MSTHALIQQILSTHYMPGFVLVPWNNTVNDTDKFLALMQLVFWLVAVERDRT